MAGEELRRVEFKGDASLNFNNLTFIVLSSILASTALLAGSVPVLIGSMILAPTFDPLIAVAFGLVTRDWPLARRGLLISVALFLIAFFTCLGTAWLLTHFAVFGLRQGILSQAIITERLTVGWHSVIIALAAGAGGAVAFASERKSNLVGMVIALALIPAIAAAAIGFLIPPLSGWGGLALFGINFGGIIVAGYLILQLRIAMGKAEEKSDTDE